MPAKLSLNTRPTGEAVLQQLQADLVR